MRTALSLLAALTLAACASCVRGPGGERGEVQGHLALAAERRNAGDVDGALFELNRALEMEPSSEHALVRRASLHVELDELDAARADFDRAIEINPDNAIAFLGRGILRRRAKDLEGSLRDLDRAVALAPKLPQAYLTRGASRAATGDMRGAIDDFTQASALDPELYRAYLWRAYAFVALERTDRALADLNRVRDHALDPVLVERADDLLREIRLKPKPEE